MHDGSFFGDRVKLWVFLPAGFLLLGLVFGLSGVGIGTFGQPHLLDLLAADAHGPVDLLDGAGFTGRQLELYDALAFQHFFRHRVCQVYRWHAERSDGSRGQVYHHSALLVHLAAVLRVNIG